MDNTAIGLSQLSQCFGQGPPSYAGGGGGSGGYGSGGYTPAHHQWHQDKDPADQSDHHHISKG